MQHPTIIDLGTRHPHHSTSRPSPLGKGADVRPLDATRLIGMGIVLFGVWLTVK